jgi:hypothetical protein
MQSAVLRTLLVLLLRLPLLLTRKAAVGSFSKNGAASRNNRLQISQSQLAKTYMALAWPPKALMITAKPL